MAVIQPTSGDRTYPTSAGVGAVWRTRYSRMFGDLASVDIHADGDVVIDGLTVTRSLIAARTVSLDVVNGTGIVWVHAANQQGATLKWDADEVFPTGNSESHYRVEWIIGMSAVIANLGARVSLFHVDTTLQGGVILSNAGAVAIDNYEIRNFKGGAAVDVEGGAGQNNTDVNLWHFDIDKSNVRCSVLNSQASFVSHGVFGPGDLLFDVGVGEESAVGASRTIFTPDNAAQRMLVQYTGVGVEPQKTITIYGLRVQELVS